MSVFFSIFFLIFLFLSADENSYIYIYRYQHYISIIIIIIIIIMIAPYVLKRGNITEEGCYHNFPFCLSILYFKN